MNLVDNQYFGLSTISSVIWQALQRQACREDLLVALHDVLHGLTTEEMIEICEMQIRCFMKLGLLCAQADQAISHSWLRPVVAVEPVRFELSQSTVLRTRFSWIFAIKLYWAALISRRHISRVGILGTLERLPQFTTGHLTEPCEKKLYSVAKAYFISRLPFAQSREDCVVRSLALVRVLRSHNLPATVCFGVKKFPFKAHAWVETGPYVINEKHSTVREYCVIARF